MKRKNLVACLVILFISITSFAQNSDSTAVTIDPAKRERSDDERIQWRNISKTDLLAAKHIEDLLTNVPKDRFEVISCKVTFDGENVPYFEYDIKGNEFSEAVRGNIIKTPARAKIMIEYIKASLPDGTVRLLNPVNLILTE